MPFKAGRTERVQLSASYLQFLISAQSAMMGARKCKYVPVSSTSRFLQYFCQCLLIWINVSKKHCTELTCVFLVEDGMQRILSTVHWTWLSCIFIFLVVTIMLIMQDIVLHGVSNACGFRASEQSWNFRQIIINQETRQRNW